MKKYYFIVYKCTYYSWRTDGVSAGVNTTDYNDVIDIHPIQYQIESNEKYAHQRPMRHGVGTCKEDYFVTNWIEITEEEYNEFNGKIG